MQGSLLLCVQRFGPVGNVVVLHVVSMGTSVGLAVPGEQGGACSWRVAMSPTVTIPSNTGATPPPLCVTVLAYMQLLEDYSEPQPSMFYQTPQNEHIYQQKNKLLMEVYGFNDSFSTEAPQELAPPPALPPKQRQLVSHPLPCPTAAVTLRFRQPQAAVDHTASHAGAFISS